MTGRRLSLHQLCLRDLGPVDLVPVARQAGFASVSVFLYPPAPQLDIFPRLTVPETSAFRAACAREGVSVHNIEALPVSGRTEIAVYLPVLDHAADIGATRATLLVYDQNLDRAGGKVVNLCDAAAQRGIALSIEFMAFSALRNVGQAAEFVRNLSHANLSLLVDPLHLARTGGTPADLLALAETIGCLQFCDAPRDPPTDLFAEAIDDRQIPGEGDLPLADLLAATDPSLPVDVEVPMLRLQRAGVTPVDRARRLMASLSRFPAL